MPVVRPASRSTLAVAVLAAVAFGVAAYLVLTVGVRAATSSAATPTTAPGSVPEFVYSPPETVPTTELFGPVGPVSMVFAGSRVVTGLSGEMQNPWIAVSSQTGDYRALSAPHRPGVGPDAVAVAPDGRALAWGFEDGVVVYDPVHDTSRELAGDLGSDPRVGRFSPDGRLLTVYDGSLRILDVRSGEVLSTLRPLDEKAARQAVWTPDGAALTYVADGRLVIHAWRSDARVAKPARITPGATLAWQPSGRQLAALTETRGVRFVQLFDVAGQGRLEPAGTVDRNGYAIQDLLGYTNDNRVAVSALTLETGPLPLVFTMSTVEDSPPTKVMQLSGKGRWETLRLAAEPLSFGSSSFEEPNWPSSDRSKLVASVIAAFFALGLYLTRRPRGA